MMCFCFFRSQTTQVPLAWPLARMCCTFRFHARQPTSGFAPPEVAGDPCRSACISVQYYRTRAESILAWCNELLSNH